MSKIKWLITLLAGLGMGQAVNFLSELTFPFVDPQGDAARRLLLIFLFGLFYLGMYGANAWAARQPTNNPASPQLLGWTEAVEIVSLGSITALTLCENMARQNGPAALAQWATVAGLWLASLIQVWPSERKEQYKELEAWLLVQLRRYQRVSIASVLARYARTSEDVNAGESPEATPKAREYLALVRWFIVNYRDEFMMGEGWIVPRPRGDQTQDYTFGHTGHVP